MKDEEGSAHQHAGRNLQRIRTCLGIKQNALAKELGISQQAISKMEQHQEIDEDILKKIAHILGIPSDIMTHFDEEKLFPRIHNDNCQHPLISQPPIGSEAIYRFNPIEKIIELYERLLQSEREKVDILKSHSQEGKK